MQQDNIPIKTTAATYGISKSTLHNYYTGKVKFQAWSTNSFVRS